MKNNHKLNQELESLALDLLDCCGGELDPKGIRRFWQLKDQVEVYSYSLKQYIEQLAEQLITNP